MNRKTIGLLVVILFIGNTFFIGVQSAVEINMSNEGDLSILSVDPIQVVNTFGLDPEITNKSTSICVCIHSTYPNTVHAKIDVEYNFGNFKYREEGRNSNGIPIKYGDNRIYIPGGPAFNGDDTPWIEPDKHPYLFWDHSGWDEDVVVEIDPDNEIIEENENNNIWNERDWCFVDTKEFRIYWLPVHFIGDTPWTLDESDVIFQMDYMRSIYPISNNKIKFCFETNSYNCGMETIRKECVNYSRFYNKVGNSLANQISTDWGYDRVVFVIDKYIKYHIGGLRYYNGIAVGMGQAAMNQVPILLYNKVLSSKESLFAHELGHTCFLWHPHDLGPDVYEAAIYNVIKREYEDIVATHMSYRDEPHWIDIGRYRREDSFIPKGTIVYCPGDPNIPELLKGYDELPWDYILWNLFDQFAYETPPVEKHLLRVGGIIKDEWDVELIDTIPFYDDSPIPPIINCKSGNQIQGDYKIVLLDFYNNVLEEKIIDYSKYKMAENDFITDEENILFIEDKIMSFSVDLPWDEDTRYVQIRDVENGEVLAEREVTINEPIIEVMSPNGGEKIEAGNIFTIKWNVFDRDGDVCRFSVGYSNDSGETWAPFAFNLEDTYYNWDTSGLKQGDNYLIKVVASDGVNTESDISDDVFSLPKTKEFKNPFIGFLEDHPNLFPLLRQILGL